MKALQAAAVHLQDAAAVAAHFAAVVPLYAVVPAAVVVAEIEAAMTVLFAATLSDLLLTAADLVAADMHIKMCDSEAMYMDHAPACWQTPPL